MMKNKKPNMEKLIEMMGGYGSPRWSGEINECAVPVTLDTYDHCGYNCLYCFSWFQKSLKAFNPLYPNQTKNYQALKLRSVDPKSIKKLFDLQYDNEESGFGQFTEFIRQKRVMQWGGLADPFDSFEKKYGISLAIMQAIEQKNYPFTFSTKGAWFPFDDRYREIFETQDYWNVKFSIINLDTASAKKMEKGVASPEKRLEAMKKLNSYNKGGVTLRLRPFIIGLSDKNDEYLELIKLAHAAGAEAVSTEFFCLEGRAHAGTLARYAAMSEIVGYDIHEYYRRNSPKQSGYLRLNRNLKLPYFRKMADLCDKLDMRFAVSDAHCKDLGNAGGCCGINPKWNYTKGQYTEMVQLAKTRADRKVYWNDMLTSGGMDIFKKFKYRHASGFNTIGSKNRTQHWNETMYDYLKDNWNKPNSSKSPYKFLVGLLHPVGLDEDSNVIYQLKETT